MRIAHLIWSLGIGGAQTMLADIVNIQVQKGHEVGIFVLDSLISNTIINKLDSRVKVFYMGRRRDHKNIMPFIRLNLELWRYKPDIIHSHAGKLINALLTNVPKVATIHNTNLNINNYKKYQKLYAISLAVNDDWINRGGKNTIIIENGIPINLIKQKNVWHITDDIHIVQVSRIFFQQKRQDLIVQALAKIKEMYNNHKIRRKCILHFVGSGVDFDRLRRLVKDLGVEDFVVFEGQKDRSWIYEHLCDFDLFVQASDFEGFGLTVAEACAAKLPVLVSDIQGPLEIIDGGKLGLTFKKGDADDLALQMSKFINGEYDYTLIEKAYKRITQKYSIEETVQKYIDEYHKVINK